MKQHYYIFLCLNINIVFLCTAMQEHAYLTQMPDLVVYNTLKYLSTEHILLFREVNKRAQQVVELLLSTIIVRR